MKLLVALMILACVAAANRFKIEPPIANGLSIIPVAHGEGAVNWDETIPRRDVTIRVILKNISSQDLLLPVTDWEPGVSDGTDSDGEFATFTLSFGSEKKTGRRYATIQPGECTEIIVTTRVRAEVPLHRLWIRYSVRRAEEGQLKHWTGEIAAHVAPLPSS